MPYAIWDAQSPHETSQRSRAMSRLRLPLFLLLLLASLTASALGGVAADPLTAARLGIAGAGAERFAFFAGGYSNGYAPLSYLLDTV